VRDQTKAILKQSSSHEQDRSKPNHVFKLLLKGIYPGPWLSTTDIINISLAEWKCWDKLGSMLQSNLDKSFPIKYIFFKKSSLILKKILHSLSILKHHSFSLILWTLFFKIYKKKAFLKVLVSRTLEVILNIQSGMYYSQRYTKKNMIKNE